MDLSLFEGIAKEELRIKSDRRYSWMNNWIELKYLTDNSSVCIYTNRYLDKNAVSTSFRTDYGFLQFKLRYNQNNTKTCELGLLPEYYANKNISFSYGQKDIDDFFRINFDINKYISTIFTYYPKNLPNYSFDFSVPFSIDNVNAKFGHGIIYDDYTRASISNIFNKSFFEVNIDNDNSFRTEIDYRNKLSNVGKSLRISSLLKFKMSGVRFGIKTEHSEGLFMKTSDNKMKKDINSDLLNFIVPERLILYSRMDLKTQDVSMSPSVQILPEVVPCLRFMKTYYGPSYTVKGYGNIIFEQRGTRYVSSSIAGMSLDIADKFNATFNFSSNSDCLLSTTFHLLKGVKMCLRYSGSRTKSTIKRRPGISLEFSQTFFGGLFRSENISKIKKGIANFLSKGTFSPDA